MSLSIYTYSNPYEISNEPYWDSIKNCAHFCVSQTMVNGLSEVYDELKNGQLTTVEELVKALYPGWFDTKTYIEQYTILTNTLDNVTPNIEQERWKKIKQSLRFNKSALLDSIRLMVEMGLLLKNLKIKKITEEQTYLIAAYNAILHGDKANKFSLRKHFSEKEIDSAVQTALVAKDQRRGKKIKSVGKVDCNTVVIHGVHQFTPTILSMIEEVSKYKRVVLLFNYQQQYSEIYQTWLDVYSCFDLNIRYGISNAINEIIESSRKMEMEVREEQHFDSAAFIYATLNQELKRLLHYYTTNENELFANTMMGWANLAGLKGQFGKDGVVRFNEGSFSIKSAENSMLIPPNWIEYVNRTSNVFSRKIRELYEERTGKKIVTESREIVGTFNRELSIENDFLHFFAPGDEVFDCIVDNAMNSYKGTCTAIAVESDFDWCGIVYTWNLHPNEQLLLEKGIPITMIRQYKSYISADQILTAISTQKYGHVPEEKVLKLLDAISKEPISCIRSDVVHLGRRSIKTDSLHIKEKYGCANIDWFRKVFPEEQWINFVSTSMKSAKSQIKEKIKASRNLKQAAASIEQTLNAEVAQAKFFGVDVGEIEQKKQVYETVLDALSFLLSIVDVARTNLSYTALFGILATSGSSNNCLIVPFKLLSLLRTKSTTSFSSAA